MSALANYGLVFVAGLVTALATGLGALPFFFTEEVSDRWNVALWGIASGIMLSASLFGLIREGLAVGTYTETGIGLLAGVLLVLVAERVIDASDFGGKTLVNADRKQLALILGVLTVHSFPEGVAVGVAFADLNLDSGLSVLGFSVPILAVFMTLAISIHNVPEGVATSIPLSSMGVSRWKMVAAAVFTSLPQPIGAVLAFVFVRWARGFLPVGFGFAAGAMIFLVLSEFIPEGLEVGEDLPNHGYAELGVGLLGGMGVMVPLVFI